MMDLETLPMAKKEIQAGDTVLLWFADEVTYMVQLHPAKRLPIHIGRPIAHDDLIGRSYGDWFEVEGGRALLLAPTLEDFIMKARRASGIIYPKDAAVVLMRLGITSGSRVIEVGTGSGALTLALAAQTAPSGMVYSYDLRDDFLGLARQNLERAKLLGQVELVKRIGHEPFRQEEVDAVVLDVPEPWHEVEAVKRSLKNGGRLAALNPTYNQIEQMSGALGDAGFVMIEALEVLVRPILARPGKTRPVQRMVSHTEFILFAVKPAA